MADSGSEHDAMDIESWAILESKANPSFVRRVRFGAPNVSGLCSPKQFETSACSIHSFWKSSMSGPEVPGGRNVSRSAVVGLYGFKDLAATVVLGMRINDAQVASVHSATLA